MSPLILPYFTSSILPISPETWSTSFSSYFLVITIDLKNDGHFSFQSVENLTYSHFLLSDKQSVEKLTYSHFLSSDKQSIEKLTYSHFLLSDKQSVEKLTYCNFLLSEKEK